MLMFYHQTVTKPTQETPLLKHRTEDSLHCILSKSHLVRNDTFYPHLFDEVSNFFLPLWSFPFQFPVRYSWQSWLSNKCLPFTTREKLCRITKTQADRLNALESFESQGFSSQRIILHREQSHVKNITAIISMLRALFTLLGNCIYIYFLFYLFIYLRFIQGMVLLPNILYNSLNSLLAFLYFQHAHVPLNSLHFYVLTLLHFPQCSDICLQHF